MNDSTTLASGVDKVIDKIKQEAREKKFHINGEMVDISGLFHRVLDFRNLNPDGSYELEPIEEEELNGYGLPENSVYTHTVKITLEAASNAVRNKNQDKVFNEISKIENQFTDSEMHNESPDLKRLIKYLINGIEENKGLSMNIDKPPEVLSSRYNAPLMYTCLVVWVFAFGAMAEWQYPCKNTMEKIQNANMGLKKRDE